MTDTYKIQFNKRSTFELALAIIRKEQDEIFNTYQTEDSFYDVGHSDMIITFASKLIMDIIISELSVAQIWNKPSFKGDADLK